MAGVRSSLKSSCCTGNMKANVERVVPITIQYHKSMAIQQDNSPWGRMAHSTSPTVNRSSIPPWPVSRGAMAREMDADFGTKRCGEKTQADDPHPMHTEIPRGGRMAHSECYKLMGHDTRISCTEWEPFRLHNLLHCLSPTRCASGVESLGRLKGCLLYTSPSPRDRG